MKQQVRFLLIVMVAVAILGEWRIFLFDHAFRFSLAVIFFAFILLWRKDISPLLVGVCVGSFVVFFRIGLDVLVGKNMLDSFCIHFPAFFFYITYSLLFVICKVRKHRNSVFLAAGLLIIIEILSNVVELQVRATITDFSVQFSDLHMIMFIAFIRSSAAVGFFTFLLFREAKVNEEATRAKNEKMLAILSDLYGETIQLQNSIKDIEKLTIFCKETVRRLENSRFPENQKIAGDVLWITCEVHELQKNYHRINAGLQQIITNKIAHDTMNIQELVQYVINSNKKYSLHLQKDIEFTKYIEPNDYDVQILKLLPIFQNLLVNAVEAIDSTGKIEVEVYRVDDTFSIHMKDNGPGIPDQEKPYIFQLGYSTKFKSDGTMSTGIGLYYVHEIVTKLGGSIQVKDGAKGTYMYVQLPFEKIKVE
ncbi:two-component system sensor histidine kinase YcbA [Evansella vedderi]|uniref:histidine kinase n=1 Tax=Evansella vedderi TaxID=38282 RepID=A0ABT9ZPS7_9BACI|nr:ATP-binding protein [Evansella vedderi]MDQ0252849.1 two-component system sensor histidine kinase YcbA [Evansella vedderi]